MGGERSGTPSGALRLAGVELYFDDLNRAGRFYRDTLGLEVTELNSGHHLKFGGATGFICLERRGSESYPSRDKAVLFFEVTDLEAAVKRIGRERFVQVEAEGRGGWAVLHDPEGHNVILLDVKARKPRRKR
jgi:predicted enzyme related to lactoylglutathione lyase